MGLSARGAPMLPVWRWRRRADLLPQDLRRVARGADAPTAVTYGRPSRPPPHPLIAPSAAPGRAPMPIAAAAARLSASLEELALRGDDPALRGQVALEHGHLGRAISGA